jgi:hypothetical protein
LSSELVLNLRFGRDSGDANYLGVGWSGDEDGYRWMTGEWTELWLEYPGPGNYVLELELSPFVHPPALLAQRLAVAVRGTVVGRSTVSGLSTLGYRIPAELLAGEGPVRLGFLHPDAARPVDLTDSGDDRRLALSVRRFGFYRISGDMSQARLQGGAGVTADEIEALVGMPARQFMLGFESLGDNCEFGLVQRRCGAEPLGLLRFSNIELGPLLRGLMAEFEGFGARETVEFALSEGERREYVLYEKQYALTFHTFQYEGEVDAPALMGKQIARLQLLRRKFLEDLREGGKIFVCKRNEALSEQEILPLHAALNRFATNTLLYLTPADAEHPPGTVERLMPGLLRGWIDRLAPPKNAHDLSLECWLAVCVNAYRLMHEPATATIIPASQWSGMDDDELRRRLWEYRWGQALRNLYLPRRASQVVPRHAELYDCAAAHIGPDSPIDLLEFGVGHGHTMRALLSRFRSPGARFVGFDSFVGLPEPWQMHDRGAFSAGGNPPAIGDARVQFIKGWFQDTVPGFLAGRSDWRSPVLVHFDADLYSSTLFLLTTLWHYVWEYFFVMDDFIFDEMIALHDFSMTYPVEIEFFAQTTGGGSLPNPDQVFGCIKRTGFRLPD